jgi:hypothetical protein
VVTVLPWLDGARFQVPMKTFFLIVRIGPETGHGRFGPWSFEMVKAVHGALKMDEVVHGPWTGRSMEL